MPRYRRHRLRSGFLFLAAVVLSLGAAGKAPGQAPSGAWLDLPIAVLKGLDKVTARVVTFNVASGDSERFGTLGVAVHTCRKRPPTERPESAAFLQITEHRQGQSAESLFSGWMFASSPALNPLEHPVYDVWIIDCRNSSTSESSSAQ